MWQAGEWHKSLATPLHYLLRRLQNSCGLCMAVTGVTDESYVKEPLPNVCYAACLLECQEERRRIVGCFIHEQTMASWVYRRELLGSIVIRLILLAANKVHPGLTGLVNLYSDCIGVLEKVSDLPPNRKSSWWCYLDILKNIMVNCSDLMFTINYSHVRAIKTEVNIRDVKRLHEVCNFHKKLVPCCPTNFSEVFSDLLLIVRKDCSNIDGGWWWMNLVLFMSEDGQAALQTDQTRSWESTAFVATS